MRVGEHVPIELVYCLNVFADDSPTGYHDTILPACRRVADQMRAPDTPAGLGLRLSRRSLTEILEPDRLEAFLADLQELQLYGVTFNAFPYGAFHGQPVKAAVYDPDWRTEERVQYTLDAAHFLAFTLPEGAEGSVSTCPVAYGPHLTSESDLELSVEHLARTVLGLVKLEEEEGHCIHLGLEPEPDGVLETTSQTVDFFKHRVLRDGVRCLQREVGVSRDKAEGWMRRHLGICFDACHLSLQFESLADSVNRIRAEGIRLSKVHFSAALELENTEAGRQPLARFDEPVYLHQTRLREPEADHAWPDLGPALEALPDHGAGTLRSHFHVPLHWEGQAPLFSTAHCMDERFFRAVHASGCRHWEAETYTFDVLPQDLRPESLEMAMLLEMDWVRQRLPPKAQAMDVRS